MSHRPARVVSRVVSRDVRVRGVTEETTREGDVRRRVRIVIARDVGGARRRVQGVVEI